MINYVLFVLLVNNSSITFEFENQTACENASYQMQKQHMTNNALCAPTYVKTK